MKRSEINRSIGEARRFFGDCRYALPGYAKWGPAEWTAAGPEYGEVRELGLGWDVTDFGSGDLWNVGRTIFTLRNGRDDAEHPKSYAHKVMHMREGQKSVIHCHRSKMEDIHNVWGGNILIRLWHNDDGALGEAALQVSVSGRHTTVTAGEVVRLSPGDWICVPTLVYHQFWAEEGQGDVLSEEVSTVCNDYTDNVFLEDGERFPAIEEDEPARYVLVNEYSG